MCAVQVNMCAVQVKAQYNNVCYTSNLTGPKAHNIIHINTYHAFLCHLLALCAFCTLVYMFIHESCLLVCHPCFNTMRFMDIRSKPTFVPCEHHLLFAILLVYLLLVVCYLACLPLCSYVCSHLVCYACHCYLACSFCALLLLSMHLSSSIARLLASCLFLCMYTHGARTHGARARFPMRKQKGQGCEHVDISEAAMFSRFKGLASPIWLCMNGAKLQAHSIIVLQ